MKLSEYAKKNGVTYRTAHNHWKKGLLKGHQLPTGTIIRFFDNFCPKLQKRLNSGYEREPENLRDNTKYSEFTS